MRISFLLQGRYTALSLNQREESINRLSSAISSGSRLSAPSDDPSAWTRAMKFRQSLREYDAILDNIDFATGWNQATDAALSDLSDLVSQARQTAISALSASGQDKQTALASELEGILQQALSSANAQYGDQYVFGGTETGSPPFSIDETTGVVTYGGNSDQITIRTDKSGSNPFTVNLSGGEILSFSSGGSTLNALSEIWELKNAIETWDTETINSKLDTLDDAFDSIGKQSTIAGNRLSALEERTSAINAIITNESGSLSEVADTDLSEALTRLEQEQVAFQAALTVTSLVSGLNLANYLSA